MRDAKNNTGKMHGYNAMATPKGRIKSLTRVPAALLLAGFCFNQAVAADVEKTTVLDEVNVSASVAPANNGYFPAQSSTALGTDKSVLDTPFTVNSVSREVIDDQGASSIADVVRNVAGVSVGSGEDNRDELYLRGVQTKSDFLSDGMRDDSEYFRPLYNVERVDVLKGPAALRFGRAGAGGVVNLVKKKAEQRDIRHLELEVGSWDKKVGRFDLGSAVGEKGALRLMGMREQSNGYRDYHRASVYAINPEMLYKFNEVTEIHAGVSYLKDHRFADRGIPSREGSGRPDSRFGHKKVIGDRHTNYADQEVTSGHIDIKHDLNDNWTLKNQLNWTQNKRYYQNLYADKPTDFSGAILPGDFRFKGYGHASKRRSIENRLELVGTFNTGSIEHTLLTGLDYTRQHDHDSQLYPEGETGKGMKNHPLGNVNGPLTLPGIRMTVQGRDNSVSVNEYGYFLQDDIKLNEQWQLLLGGRFDHFSTRAEWAGEVNPSESNSRVDNKFSPRAALTFKPTESQSIYTSFSRTYTPTGANLAFDLKSPNGSNIAPERADSVEVGHKMSFLDDRFMVATAVFQIDQTNIKDKDPVSGETMAIGKHRTRGVEFSVTGELTDSWKVLASYAYLDSKTRKTVDKVPSGRRIDIVPNNQFSIWSTYDITQNWGVGGGVHGASVRYASLSNEVKMPGYVVGDVMAYYQAGKYRVQLNVDNVGNTHYYTTAHGDKEIMPSDARSANVKVSMDF